MPYVNNWRDEGDIAYVDCYLHGDSDEYAPMWDTDAEQQITFDTALYEVKVTLIVNMKTGESEIWAVNDKRIAD